MVSCPCLLASAPSGASQPSSYDFLPCSSRHQGECVLGSTARCQPFKELRVPCPVLPLPRTAVASWSVLILRACLIPMALDTAQRAVVWLRPRTSSPSLSIIVPQKIISCLHRNVAYAIVNLAESCEEMRPIGVEESLPGNMPCLLDGAGSILGTYGPQACIFLWAIFPEKGRVARGRR